AGTPRRRGPSRRRALALLVASGLALVGVVTLGVVYAGIGVRTLRASVTADEPCLVAYDQDVAGARVRYTVLPAEGVCTWDVDGRSTDVVVASAPTPLVAGAWVLAVGGVAGVGVVLVPRPVRARPNG
ncbi:hypothetical protein AB6N23_14930, partial [Cellulomonas sp. 179-A 9B4 NHS]|uniref:hypothetical protein n=1 Tax=Cellulomonas sp. 179-A 9B4 NHS TaxID=3142379 RepID=UPI0039A03CD1